MRYAHTYICMYVVNIAHAHYFIIMLYRLLGIILSVMAGSSKPQLAMLELTGIAPRSILNWTLSGQTLAMAGELSQIITLR